MTKRKWVLALVCEICDTELEPDGVCPRCCKTWKEREEIKRRQHSEQQISNGSVDTPKGSNQ